MRFCGLRKTGNGYNQSSMMPDDKDWQKLRNECDKLSRFFKSDIQEGK